MLMFMGARRGASAFTPASVGALAWWDTSAASSLYQERTGGGTTPSSIGGVVGTIRDQSGNGYHLAAPSDAARGTYNTASGYSYVQTDATDDEYSTTGAAILGVLNDKDFYVGAATSSFGAGERVLFATASVTTVHVPASQGHLMSIRYNGTYYNAAGAVTMYGQGRRERGQISARTMRELELAADHLRDLAVATRDRKRL